MFEVISYLLCLDHTISSTLIRQLSIISKAMLCSRGRITMLELSRWSGKGGSYRSIRRFYHLSRLKRQKKLEEVDLSAAKTKIEKTLN
jgi:hypothetical protein